jgi:hypothetical protein
MQHPTLQKLFEELQELDHLIALEKIEQAIADGIAEADKDYTFVGKAEIRTFGGKPL